MRTSYDSVDLIPDYRMDANFRGRQFLGMSSSLEDSNSICRMHHLHSMLAISMQLTCIRVHLCMILPPGLIGEFMVPNQLLHLGIACDRVNQCILVTSRREKWLFLPHRKEVIRIRRVWICEGKHDVWAFMRFHLWWMRMVHETTNSNPKDDQRMEQLFRKISKDDQFSYI